VKPIILDFAVVREELLAAAPEMQYSERQSLNVISIGDQTIPVVDANNNVLNAQTETRKARETSDRDRLLGTETKAARESSDRALHLLGLQKKTFVARESER